VPLEEYKFVAGIANKPAKVSLIGPDRISQRFDHQNSKAVYPDMDAFMADVVAIQREMIRSVVDAGCRYVHIDAPGYTAYVDEPSLKQMRDRGENTDENFSRSLKADAAVIANSMTGTFEYEKGDTRPVPDFNVFFRYFATHPYFSDAIWYLTQMRRWGQIPEAKTDAWYDETAKKVYRPDLYLEAAKLLIADGKAKKADFPLDSDGYRAPTSEFIDGVSYDGRKPNAYIDSLKIGLKGNQRVEGLKVVSN